MLYGGICTAVLCAGRDVVKMWCSVLCCAVDIDIHHIFCCFFWSYSFSSSLLMLCAGHGITELAPTVTKHTANVV